MQSKVTTTGKKKTIKRTGVPKSAVERQFSLALERGYRQNEIKGRLSKWVTSVALAEKYKRKCIVYNNNLFVTDNEDVLITVIPIPQNLARDLKNFIKK